jgi:transposase
VVHCSQENPGGTWGFSIFTSASLAVTGASESLPLDVFPPETFPSLKRSRQTALNSARLVATAEDLPLALEEFLVKKPNKQRAAQEPSAAIGGLARCAQGTLQSLSVGALPILDHLLKRMRLEEFLRDYLPREDGRTKLSPAKALLVLLRNLLVSREPIYGMGEWAARYAPDLLGLSPEEIVLLNDDRVGRALDRLFLAEMPSLVLAVVRHVVQEFHVRLDELHNDSTTVTFFGAYLTAAQEKHYLGRPTLAITFGHNKDHRPDLKQLLYILTVTEDGGVPIHFRVASGNTSDDQTHRETWELLRQLTGRRDFLYVADCKLASTENLASIAEQGGRFISVLPRTRREDAAFRHRLQEGQVTWRHLADKTDDDGEVIDRISVSGEPTMTVEGYRLVWYHSARKAELDAAARAGQIERALRELGELRDKLISPRSRYHEAQKVEESVAKILESSEAAEWIRVQIVPQERETYRQAQPGRPSRNTRYVRKVTTRFTLAYEIDMARVAAASVCDGVFLLVSNVVELSERELLDAYKRQPTIEKRFSQLKTDFAVAPVYLKQVRRIQALLGVYFFALLVEALLERELRQAMKREGVEALPMYPEGRPCRWPTARRLIDLFEPVQRHRLAHGKGSPEITVTELTRLQRRLLKLLGQPRRDYGR